VKGNLPDRTRALGSPTLGRNASYRGTSQSGNQRDMSSSNGNSAPS
jgi:hypothetical protein